MDNKRLMIGMLVALAVLLGWNYFIATMAKKNNWDLGQQPQPTAQTQAQQQQVPGTQPSATVETAGTPAPVVGQLRVVGGETGTQASLGTTQWDDPTWSLGIDAQGQGASITSVTLNQFPKTSDRKAGPYVFQATPESGTASMATLWAKVNEHVLDLSRAAWAVEAKAADGSSITYSVTIAGEKPVARILKTYTISPKTAKPEGSEGYEVRVRHRIENLTSGPIEVQLGIAGPTTPPREIMRGPDLSVIGGYNKNPEYPTAPLMEPKVWAIESLKGDSQTVDVTVGDKGRPMIWAGQTSTYFDAVVFPVGEKNITTADFIENVQATGIMNATGVPDHAEMVFRTKSLPIAAGEKQAREFDLQVFFGPKARSVIKNNYYGVYPRDYYVTLNTGGSCICTIQQLVDAMVMLLRGFHWVLRDWGLAIIALVVLVRGIMHPLTRKSQVSMQKMQKLAPELERIKAKFKDNPEEQQRATMAFYKEHGASQLFGCLPMFIQMPIWVALWSCLQGTFELRQAPFLWGYTWIHDLAKPDRLIPLPHMSLWFFSIDGINLLPILMGVFFFLQQKYFTPKAAAATPEQEQQQKMMQWMMVLMFPLMLYNGPAGLNLYIFTSTAVGMLESKWIRDQIKAREAAEAAAGPVIIDAPANRGGKRRRDDDAAAMPKGRLAQWIERMQKMAEDAQKQQQKRGKK